MPKIKIQMEICLPCTKILATVNLKETKLTRAIS